MNTGLAQLTKQISEVPRKSQVIMQRVDEFGTEMKELENLMVQELSSSMEESFIDKFLPEPIKKKRIHNRLAKSDISQKLQTFITALNRKVSDISKLVSALNKLDDDLLNAKGVLENLASNEEDDTEKEYYLLLSTKIDMYLENNEILRKQLIELFKRGQKVVIQVGLDASYAFTTYTLATEARKYARIFNRVIDITNRAAIKATDEMAKHSEEMKQLSQKQTIDIDVIKSMLQNLSIVRDNLDQLNEIQKRNSEFFARERSEIMMLLDQFNGGDNSGKVETTNIHMDISELKPSS